MKLDFNFRHTGPLIPLQALTELEQNLSVTLPEDYKRFLLAFNGGYPEHEAFNYDGNKSFAIQRFYPLTDDDVIRVDLLRDAYGDSVADLLQIGISSFGDPLCLAVGAIHHGSVWWYNHEYDPDDDPHNGLTELAPTFEDFLMGLKPI